MDRDGRAWGTAALLLGLVLLFESAPTLSLNFAGDDFELFALARIGGFSPAALFVPHRGGFVKPILNIAWAALVAVFGARPAPWHAVLLAVHLLNAALLGVLAARLSAAWRGGAAGGRSVFPASGGSNAPSASEAKGASATTGEPYVLGASRVPSASSAASNSSAERPRSRPLQRTLENTPASRGLDMTTGLLAAGIWAVHDRLLEPVFSIASLNHSLTFVFYLGALLCLLRAIDMNTGRDRLIASLFMVLALFSYEISVSLIPAAVLLVALHGRRTVRERFVWLGPPMALAVSAYAAVQLVTRLGPEGAGTSYYAFTPSLAAANLSEIGLSFLHVRSDWVAPGVLPAVVFAGAFLLVLLRARDPIVRFGLGWSLASWLPVAAIPHFSDRYHYIAFAGLALAAGRAAALAFVPARDLVSIASLDSECSPASESRLVFGGSHSPSAYDSAASSTSDPLTCASSSVGARKRSTSLPIQAATLLTALLLLVHGVWSVGGSRDVAGYHRLAGTIPESLLREARAALALPQDRRSGGSRSGSSIAVADPLAVGDDVPAVLALVWPDDPEFHARYIQDGEARLSTRSLGPLAPSFRFGERFHSIYVRADGILGAVYPLDLLNVAGSSQGAYFRTPGASVAARAIVDETVQILPIGFGDRRLPDLPSSILRHLREVLLVRREIPIRLPTMDGNPMPLRMAYVERTDRMGAFDAEYGKRDRPGGGH